MTTPDCGPKCQEILREIEAFLDGELEITVRMRIEHHLSDCSPCMQRAEFRRHVKVLVRDRCANDEVPAGLDARIRSLIHDIGASPTS